MSEWMNGQIGERVGERLDGWTEGEWVGGRMDGWKDRRVSGWVNGWLADGIK